MLERSSPPKQTSGGGFLFENEVVAYVLAFLLDRRSPFEPPGGVVERVAPQRPATEWHLDDLLVTVRAHDRKHRLAFWIKSNSQVTKAGLPTDFVRAAWEQILHEVSDVFDEERDYLGLITAPVAADLRRRLSELLRLARDQPPADLAFQVGLPGRVNDVVRAIHESARCPADLAQKHALDVEASAGRLLRRLLWHPFDFEEESSDRRREALSLCRNLLLSGSSDEASALWERLKGIADRLRRSSGTIDLPRLVGELRGHFELRGFPDHTRDWNRLDKDTDSAVARVRMTIGGDIRLPRDADHRKIAEALEGQQSVVLVGASGVGKSGLARAEAEEVIGTGKVLWLDSGRIRARTLADWRSYLGLNHPLEDLVRSTPVARALLVLDGLDRIYEDDDFATVAEFVDVCRVGNPESPWRLLITCTPDQWERVRGELTTRGLRQHVQEVRLGMPKKSELEAVWTAFPHLRALRGREHLAPVLLRPKVLDLLAVHGTPSDDLQVLGESHIARLLWERMIAKGPRAVARGEAAGRLAERLADDLETDLPVSELVSGGQPIDPTIVDDLVRDRILLDTNGGVGFEHDLYGDWLRSRRLLDAYERGALADLLEGRTSSPIWHRALRLLGIDLLEQSEGLDRWQRAFQIAGDLPGSSGIVAQDILLEATVFVAVGEAGVLHDDLWPLLMAEDGRLLGRLLVRLQHAATTSNTLLVGAGLEQIPDLELHLATAFRLPSWPYWPGILTLLSKHREELAAGARAPAARIADLWLRSTRLGWPLRKEAAAIAVTLGDSLLKEKEGRRRLFQDAESDREVYRAVLAAGHEEPQRVAQILLEAVGRRNQRFAPPPPTEEEVAEARRKQAAFSSVSAIRSGPLPDPWPHGPAFRVDGSLQEVVLESADAVLPLIDALPEVAREMVLALLIAEPDRRGRRDDPYRLDLGLQWRSWHPQFYARGPFLAFLRQNEEVAVRMIIELVEHATDRWAEAVKRRVAWERRRSPDSIEVPTVSVEVQGEMRRYIGDERVFGWCVYHPEDGDSVGCALVALEKYLYDRADAGGPLDSLIQRLLADSRSLAVVGLLSLVGRRHPRYFRGPLRGLLACLEAVQWTLGGSVEPVWQYSLYPGLNLVPRPLEGLYRQWHEMPHRKRSLRDFAAVLLLNDPETRSYLLEARKRLIENLQPGGDYEGWSFAEHYAAQLNPDNYESIAGGNEIALRYVPPPELVPQRVEVEEQQAVDLALISVPVQCRQLIEAGGAVGEEVLDQMWEQSQGLEALDPDAGPEFAPPGNSLAALAAALVLRGEGWLQRHPDRARWARGVLLEAAGEERDEQYLGGANQWDRRSFAAEALPTLLADSPTDSEIRSAIAHLACHGPQEIVGVLVVGTYRIRERLADDHKRLLGAVLRRAGLSPQLWKAESNRECSVGENRDVDWEKEAERLKGELAGLEESLANATAAPRIPSLEEVAPVSSSPASGFEIYGGRRKRVKRRIAENLAVAAYRGLPIPEPGEREPWLGIWSSIARDVAAPLAQSEDEASREPQGNPGILDRYLVERLADSVAAVNNRNLALPLWKPIIKLGTSAPDWVTALCRCWTVHSLHPTASDAVVGSWLDMIDLALQSPRWAGGSPGTALGYDTSKLWRALLALDRASPDVWIEELGSRVRLLENRLETWARAHLSNADNSRAFAHFLTLPAAGGLLLSGLVWLHDAAVDAGEGFWKWPHRAEATEDAVVSLLDHVWRKLGKELRSVGGASDAFRGLLEMLLSRQNPEALELAERVGMAGRGPSSG